MINIDKDIPTPQGRLLPQSQQGELRAAFSSMNPGDSFIWHNAQHPHLCAKKLGIKIATKKCDGYVRVWMKGTK